MNSNAIGQAAQRLSLSVMSPIRYMLREQRYIFILIGLAIPAAVFNVFHVSTPSMVKEISAEPLHSTEVARIPRRMTYELHNPIYVNIGTLVVHVILYILFCYVGNI